MEAIVQRTLTTLHGVGAAPILFRHLVDDAALFPPGNAPMAAAVPGHLALRRGPHAGLVGPFLCPASRLGELRDQLDAAGEGDVVDLGLIVDTGLDGVGAALDASSGDARLRVAMVEVPVPAGSDLVAGARAALAQSGGHRLYVELPRTAGWLDALDVIAAAGQGAKFRTGGLRAELFPSNAELAAFVAACAGRAVAFKCTAGLHHAVRHTDPETGLRHHGFLNILLATARAVRREPIEPALAEEDERALAAAASAVDDSTATAARRLFHSYGSCSIDEPVADLRRLGLLP